MNLTFDQFKELYGNFKKSLADQNWPSKELFKLNQFLSDLSQNPSIRKTWEKDYSDYFNVEFLFGFTQRLVSQKTVNSKDVSLVTPVHQTYQGSNFPPV